MFGQLQVAERFSFLAADPETVADLAQAYDFVRTEFHSVVLRGLIPVDARSAIQFSDRYDGEGAQLTMRL